MLQWEGAPHRGARLSMIAVVGLIALAFVAPVRAADEVKSERANGKLVSYDASAQTIVVKEGGKEQPYQVKAEGSVLTRTTVTMNGKVAKFDDVKPGMVVIVYWKPDPADATRRNARKMDVPKIPKEFQQEVDAAEKNAESQ
jgi:hypothetical protein